MRILIAKSHLTLSDWVVTAITVVFVLLVLCFPAWPAACALSATAPLSTATWTGAGCPATPGAGDTVTIGDGKKLTVDQNWTIGASGASNTTAAIAEDLTGWVEVSPGIALTLRGDFTYQSTWTTGITNSALTLDAGSTLNMDTSLAAGGTRYRIGAKNATYGSRPVTINGTSANPVIVNLGSGGSGLNGQFRHGATPVGGAPGHGNCIVTGAYGHFSNVGDVAANGESFAPYAYSGDASACTLTNSTFDTVGPWYTGTLAFGSASTTNWNYNTYTNSPACGANGCLPIAVEAGGTYNFTNNVFDFCISTSGGNQTGEDWSGSYLGGGVCGALRTVREQKDLFIRQPNSTAFRPNGDMTNGYYLLDVSLADNHWIQPLTAKTLTVKGTIFDSPDKAAGDSGELLSESGGTNITQELDNVVNLPSKTGAGQSALLTATNAVPGATTNVVNVYHATWTGEGGFGAIQTHEGGSMTFPLNAMESVLTWANVAGANYCKVGINTNSGTLLSPSITTADYNSADSNVLLNAVSTGCNSPCTNIVCANQGLGYIGKWPATPGTHDVSASPYLADSTRNVASWDTAYLRNALGPAWVTSTSYTVGQIVSDANAGYFGAYKSGVNFRCIANHTSGASTEPNVGASWRTDWEWASLNDIRQAMTNGVTYADGALPGCTTATPCTPIQALVSWVKRGFTPQNPVLWMAGHDLNTGGVNHTSIGAVDFSLSAPVFLGLMGAM